MLCQKNNRWTIYGITSFGEGCGRQGKYGIYAKVPNYSQWLEATIVEKLTFEQLLAILTQSLKGTLLTSLKIGPVYNEARLKHETEVIDKATNAIKDLIIVKDSKW